MTKYVFTIDGRGFSGVGVESLTRTAELRARSEYEAISGMTWRDLTGTYLSYTLQLSTAHIGRAAYDTLFEILMKPVDSHSVTVPFGQGTKTFEAKIRTVSDAIVYTDESGTIWGGLTVQFDSRSPILEA